MSLRERLEALIGAEGPITVARWMELALHDPQGDHGWALIGEVNLGESDAAGEVVFDEFEIVEG